MFTHHVALKISSGEKIGRFQTSNKQRLLLFGEIFLLNLKAHSNLFFGYI